MTSQDLGAAAAGAASPVASSRKLHARQRRAVSMDDHDAVDVDDRRPVSVDDGDQVVRSAHSSPCRSRRKLTWLRKGGALRGELDTIGSELRRVGVSLRGSIENLVNHCTSTFSSCSLSAAAACQPLQLGRRRIKVEVESHGGKAVVLRRGLAARRGWSDRVGSSYDDDDDDEFGGGAGVIPYDAPDHNFTSFLTLGALVDGQFAARLDLDRIPCGDITIRVRNYRLEVIVDRAGDPPTAAGVVGTTSRPDDAHRISRPFYCGSIDVPIYVDTGTIRLQSADDGRTDVLYINARMKGYVDSTRLSASVSDVRRLSKSSAVNAAGKGSDVTTTSEMPPSRGFTIAANHNWISLFRERAYTR